jgi:hypothetical protein
MKKIKSLLMMLAVVVAATGVFAFKANVMPPGDKFSVEGTTTIDATNPDGTFDITVGSSTVVTNINGQSEGLQYDCDEPKTPICTLVLTANTVITHNPDGTVTYTNVIITRGVFTAL